jgi:hypothetical protein
MGNRSYEEMVMKIVDNGAFLVLMDGSKWRVDPGDIPVVITWTPTAPVQVSLAYPDAAFPYELRNPDADVTVRAMKVR